MLVSNQSSAHELLARRTEAADQDEMRMRKLFARKQAELAEVPGRPGQAGVVKDLAAATTSSAIAAPVKPTGGTTAVPPALGGTAPGQPTVAALPTDVAAGLTVEGLMSRWGSSDARYDLDKSGSVDMKDLVMLLSDPGPADPAGPTADAKPSADVDPLGTSDPNVPAAAPTGGDLDGGDASAPELTMEGLMKAWGTDDPAYDLDGDGTVGMNDLLAMLSARGVESPLSTVAGGADAGGAGRPDDPALIASLASLSPGEAGAAAAGTVPDELADAAEQPVLATLSAIAPGAARTKSAAGGDADAPAPAPVDPAAAALSSTLDAIEGAEAAKKTASIAGPGTTAAIDPATPSAPPTGGPTIDPATAAGLTRIWSLAADAAGEGTMDLATMAGLGSVDVQGSTLESPEQAADHLAKQLHERFAAVGFEQAPPSNLHEVLDGLRLSGGDRKLVIERLQGLYPQGLGLNAVG